MKRIIAILFLSIIYNGLHAHNPDEAIIREVNSWNGRGMRAFSSFFSTTGEVFALAVPTGMAVYALCDDNEELLNKSVSVVTGMAATIILSYGLKYTIDRRRPNNQLPYIIKRDSPGSPSFPSTHAAMAFSLATSLSLEYPRWYVIAPTMIWASCVGFSRIHQGVHYPSDILGGMVLGAGTACLTYYLNKSWNKKKAKSKISPLVEFAYQ